MKKILLIGLCLLILGLFSINVSALGPKIDKSVAIWTQNTEIDLAGYYLYWRTPNGSFGDTNRIQVLPTAKAGTHTTPSFDLATLNLASGNYIIAVTAYDTAGNESGISTEAPFDASVPGIPTGVGVVK